MPDCQEPEVADEDFVPELFNESEESSPFGERESDDTEVNTFVEEDDD